MKRMTRTVRRGVTVGLAITTVALLTACGTSGGGTGPTEAASELGETEGQLSVLAWPGYAEDGSNDPAVDWVTPFEDATGCEVTVKTFGTSDEAVNLFKTGDYDVVSASGDASLRLVAAGDVQPVNLDLVPNYANVYDFLKDKAWNTVDGQNYGVPHGYGANLLMYSTDVFSEAPSSWGVVFDESDAYTGKVTAYDSPIYIADAAMYLMATQPDLGIENPYALDEEQLAAAVDLLKTQRANIGEYWSDYLKEIQAFTTGDTVVGTTWQVIQNVAAAEGAPTDVTVPEEGVTGWSDTWMISSSTENPNCSYAWLDYIASPEVNGQATEYFGEAPSSDEACEFRSDCEAYHAGDAAYAENIWYWTTPIEKCIDGRTDVTCTDYSAWTEAWQEIKG
ncbi:putative spermidine/putrescine transport system substrate-binding protein [Microterricola gilva]|uniref:Putative spermidine/putrescine transport system substrate-binding protein n=1 Tax=Microterricola gilva TaxID=393267 RepID=A0A4Q8AK94_9MICO|nr:extracellular solute-binding protein [Microterricola gilva]RZU64818.1 putative spermidine/putrescine transport system substrate-binding protein [Microterricola gilva]